MDSLGESADPGKKVFELAINLKELWKAMDREKRVTYLKRVCSNPTVDSLTLHYHLQKPFERLAKMKGNENWRIRRQFCDFKSLDV